MWWYVHFLDLVSSLTNGIGRRTCHLRLYLEVYWANTCSLLPYRGSPITRIDFKLYLDLAQSCRGNYPLLYFPR